MEERPTLRRNVRDLPAAVWILIGGAFINRFASFAIVFLVLYLREQGFSITRAGAAVAAYGLGEVIASAIGGHLADRVGRRTTIVISMLASAAAILALSEVGSYTSVVIVAFLAGLAFETHRPAALALVADVVPEGARVTAFAVLRLAANLGFALGSAVAGFLADRSFQWVFWTDAATSVVFAAMALALLPQGRIARRGEEERRWVYRGVAGDRPFAMFLLASVLTAFVYFQVQITLPLHVVANGLAKSDYGLMLAVNGLLVVLLELPLSAITMRLPARRMIALSFGLVALGFGLTAVAEALPLLMLTVVIWTFGEMVGVPVGYAYVASLAPEHMRGRYQGLYGLALGSGGVLGPSIGAPLFARDPTGFWSLCGALGLLSALLVLAAKPRGPEPGVTVPVEAIPEAPRLDLQGRAAEGQPTA